MQRVIVPPKIRVWQKDDWWLYFDPYNFVWARVNKHGRFLLERFRKHRTIPQIAAEVERDFGMPADDALRAVESFAGRLVESKFLHFDEYRERRAPTPRDRPFARDVYLHMTNDCNLKCPYCYNKEDRNTKLEQQKSGQSTGYLDTDEYKALIRRLIEEGASRLVMTGGEPLMRPDVLELVEYARSLSDTVTLEMLTNAILIKESNVERICRAFDAVTISLDGHESHLHEHYRGRNTFAPTIAGVRRLVEARKRLGGRSPEIVIVPALTERNIGFMKEVFAFALDDLGADGLAPIIFQAGDHQELSISQIPPLDTYQVELARTLEYLQGRRSARQRAADSDQQKAPAAKRAPLMPRYDCGVGHGEISVDPSGVVYPCQSLHFDEFICGSVREQDIKVIYDSSPVMMQVRGQKVHDVAVCSHCDLQNLCNGGCRATAYHVYRKFDAHNEIYCQYLEMIATNKLWSSSMTPLAEIEYACSAGPI